MALTVTQSVGDDGAIALSISGTPTVGDNEILAARTLDRHRVRSFALCGAGGDNVVYFKTGSTAHFGNSGAAITLNNAGPAVGAVLPRNPDGWFTGAANEALKLNCSTAEAIFCQVVVKPTT